MIRRRTFLSWLAAGAVVACVEPLVTTPASPVRLTKGPWVSVRGQGSILLRFETREDLDVPVLLAVDGVEQVVVPVRAAAELTWAWGVVGTALPLDEAGLHVLHEVVVSDLADGATVTWRVEPAPGDVREGSVQVAPPLDASPVVAWIADTMAPKSAEVAAGAVEHLPDLLIHGGDIQYTANPGDTWNGFFHTVDPLLRRAVFHTTYGNHEGDTDNEPAELFDRLFAGQGGVSHRWHVVPYGRFGFVILDSEDGALRDPEQLAFADAALDRLLDEGRWPVVCFHRPTWTFSKHSPDLGVRQVVHDLVRGRCQLVLCGHVHGYERFLVDGVTYVIDGGGGALTYDLDENVERITQERPEELRSRVAAIRAFGCTILRFQGDALVGERVDVAGAVVDRFTIG